MIFRPAIQWLIVAGVTMALLWIGGAMQKWADHEWMVYDTYRIQEEACDKLEELGVTGRVAVISADHARMSVAGWIESEDHGKQHFYVKFVSSNRKRVPAMVKFDGKIIFPSAPATLREVSIR